MKSDRPTSAWITQRILPLTLALTLALTLRLPLRLTLGLTLGLSLLSCQGEGTSSSQLVSSGREPSTLTMPLGNVGGLIEVARVRFNGDNLSSALVGEVPGRAADGLSLVVGGAGFAFPASPTPHAAWVAIPKGPVLSADVPLRCEIRPGQARLPWELEGMRVDVGARVTLEGTNYNDSTRLSLPLRRFPTQPVEGYAQQLRYYFAEPARLPSDDWDDLNWASGNSTQVHIGGAATPSAREYASLPYQVLLSDRFSLPSSLENLSWNGSSLKAPSLDPVSGQVLTSVPRIELPSGSGSALLTWTPAEPPRQLTLSVELYGPGEGNCPGGCGESSSCCQTSENCGTQETCEAWGSSGELACFPNDGDARALLTTLVCSATDSGELRIPGTQLDALFAQVGTANVRGVVVRIARVVELEASAPSVLTRDGTGHSLSSVLLRASDVVLTRAQLPSGQGE
ncbi:MAG: hypothetical protein ACKO6N_06835 [Myxococcota bacterium]